MQRFSSDGLHYFEHEGKKYHRRTWDRLTDCCGAYSTYVEGILSCKKCYHEVPQGQGDGTETIKGPRPSIRYRYRFTDDGGMEHIDDAGNPI